MQREVPISGGNSSLEFRCTLDWYRGKTATLNTLWLAPGDIRSDRPYLCPLWCLGSHAIKSPMPNGGNIFNTISDISKYFNQELKVFCCNFFYFFIFLNLILSNIDMMLLLEIVFHCKEAGPNTVWKWSNFTWLSQFTHAKMQRAWNQSRGC